MNSELRELLIPAHSTIQRVNVCVKIYKMLELSETSTDTLLQLALQAEELWFSDDKEERESSSRVLSLISLLREYGEENNAENSALNNEENNGITMDDIKYYLPRYRNLMKALIDHVIRNGYSEKEYYEKLWKNLSFLMESANEVEKGVCLYAFLLDKRTPYYSIRPGMRMTNEKYKAETEKIISEIDKMRFVFNLNNRQKTETASQLLYIMDQLDSYESRIVFLSQLIGMAGREKTEGTSLRHLLSE